MLDAGLANRGTQTLVTMELLVECPVGDTRRIVQPGQVLVIGEGPPAHIRPGDETLAPAHLQVGFEDGQAWAENLSGDGAVRLGGEAFVAGERRELSLPVVLRAGASRITLRLRTQPTPPPTPRAAIEERPDASDEPLLTRDEAPEPAFAAAADAIDLAASDDELAFADSAEEVRLPAPRPPAERAETSLRPEPDLPLKGETRQLDRAWRELMHPGEPAAEEQAAAAPLDDAPEMLLSDDGARAYQVVGLLGRGAFGQVFEVEVMGDQTFPGFEHPVERAAIKVSSDAAMLAREQQLYGGRERGLVRLLDQGQIQDGRAFLVLEKLHPHPQNRYARVGRPRPPTDPATAINLFVNLLATLAHLHYRRERPLVLGDVKPDNIMLRLSNRGPQLTEEEYLRRIATGGWEPVLIDMGCAHDRQDLTARGGRLEELIGTPLYLPPESVPTLRDDGTVTPGVYSDKTDVYALTLTFYELLTGDRAYSHRGLFQLSGSDLLHELLALKRDGSVPWNRRRLYEVLQYKGELFEELLRAGLHPDPDKRPSAVALLAEAKRRFQVGNRYVATPAEYRWDSARGCALEQRLFPAIDPQRAPYA